MSSDNKDKVSVCLAGKYIGVHDSTLGYLGGELVDDHMSRVVGSTLVFVEEYHNKTVIVPLSSISSITVRNFDPESGCYIKMNDGEGFKSPCFDLYKLLAALEEAG